MVDPLLLLVGDTLFVATFQSKLEKWMESVVLTFSERNLEENFQGYLSGQKVLDILNSHLANLPVPMAGHLQACCFSHPLLVLFLVVACVEVLSIRTRI